MESSDPSVRVVLADDHHFFREGLRDLLEEAGLSVVGEARDGSEALELAERLKPDLVVIDLDISGAPGPEALERIAVLSPGARTVVLTGTVEATKVLAALQAGACAYVVKGAQAQEMIAGIRQTAGSHVLLSRAAIDSLVLRMAAPDGASAQAPATAPEELLTARERDVLCLLAGGADNAAIGLQLSISPHTVKQHVTNIFEKLGVRTRVEAAVYAVRTGLV